MVTRRIALSALQITRVLLRKQSPDISLSCSCVSPFSFRIWRDKLTAFGQNMIRFLERPEITRMETHLAVEVEDNPKLGKLFLDAGPWRVHRLLSRLLAEAVKQGEIELDDPDQAAELLAGMFKGLADLDRRFGQMDAAKAEPATKLWIDNDREIRVFWRRLQRTLGEASRLPSFSAKSSD